MSSIVYKGGMYLQVKQAAAALGVSRQWVHTLINRGALGTATIAGRRFVVEDDRYKALRRAHTKDSCTKV